MTTDVVLTGSFRPVITTLTRVERTIEDVTSRLASGLRVQSALDDPSNFFAARALSAEASDFNRLVDSINQSIFTLQQADNGIRAITENIEQAESLALQAVELFQTQDIETVAIITGNVNLSDVQDITNLNNVNNLQEFDVVAGDGEGGTLRATVRIDTGTSGTAFASLLSNLSDGGERLNLQVKLDENGLLQIRSGNNDFFRIEASAGSANLATLTGLGLGEFADSQGNFTALAGRELRTQTLLRTDGGDLAQATDRFRTPTDVTVLSGENGDPFADFRASNTVFNDFYYFGVNGGALEQFGFFADNGTANEAVSLQEYVDNINNNAILNGTINAEFDEETAQIVIRPNSENQTSVQLQLFEFGGNNLATAFNYGGSSSLDQVPAQAGNTTTDSFVFGSIPPEAADDLEEQLADVLSSIEQLVIDSNYRGINLLDGETLTTSFNPDGSNVLNIEGRDLSVTGLGFDQIVFNSLNTANEGVNLVREGLNNVRIYEGSLSNSLSVLRTRSDFTQQRINNLQSGADDLTVADANEEGANLLALQTRQALATTSLSLASESQQSVLRLF